ncbi:SAM-dependent methyltransferase [Nesterenkonia massiliensis]|uniref:SAM-dependent methyltransferase n=1 Tax=Nesterenkonia massiliensis TaxID=1232429 RepID=UPI0003FEE5E5
MSHDFEVTGLDISSAALSRARTQTRQSGLQDRLRWIQQDVTTWQPQWSFDLV